MNNRIDARFAALARAGRVGLIPYITAGHPTPDSTVAVMHSLVEAGADLLELGVPFSDVMADGPVIQKACARALEQGMTVDRVFAMVETFRAADTETPVILMGYMNPVERRGVERFADQARAAGVDALLLVDCPADEAAETRAVLAERGMHQIFLAAPTTTEVRMQRLAQVAGGFIYYVSLKGVTGSAELDADSLAPVLARLRSHSPLPLAVGFGIATAEQAAAVAAHADAVVIGSALVRRLDAAADPDNAAAIARDYLAPIRDALDVAERATATEAGQA
ncbi:MAG: tryptophan synthase subunit alpha [Wenzhouxiangellaceae bacterium]|nr:tryptophan synthase subunit alpha [Wenzhouxiangellaceae bacterium]